MDWISEIEDRLAAATPGPWEIDNDGVNGKIASVGPVYGYDYDSLEITADDADLIAHAPADLARLVAEVRRLEGEVERLTSERDELVALVWHDEPPEDATKHAHAETVEMLREMNLCWERSAEAHARSENAERVR